MRFNACCPMCGKVLREHTLYELRVCRQMKDDQPERERLMRELARPTGTGEETGR